MTTISIHVARYHSWFVDGFVRQGETTCCYVFSLVFLRWWPFVRIGIRRY